MIDDTTVYEPCRHITENDCDSPQRDNNGLIRVRKKAVKRVPWYSYQGYNCCESWESTIIKQTGTKIGKSRNFNHRCYEQYCSLHVTRPPDQDH